MPKVDLSIRTPEEELEALENEWELAAWYHDEDDDLRVAVPYNRYLKGLEQRIGFLRRKIERG